MSPTDDLIEAYLARLERELTDTPHPERELVLDGIRSHIAEARHDLGDADEGEVRALLERLGEPSSIAAETRARLATAPRSPQTVASASLAGLIAITIFAVAPIITQIDRAGSWAPNLVLVLWLPVLPLGAIALTVWSRWSLWRPAWPSRASIAGALAMLLLLCLSLANGYPSNTGAGLPAWVLVSEFFAVLIGEEALFRGAMFDLVRRIAPSRAWAPVVLTGLVFAAYHYQFHPAQWGFLVYTALLGLVAGSMRRSSGSLAPSAVLHGINNLIAIALVGPLLALGGWLNLPGSELAIAERAATCSNAFAHGGGDVRGVVNSDPYRFQGGALVYVMDSDSGICAVLVTNTDMARTPDLAVVGRHVSVAGVVVRRNANLTPDMYFCTPNALVFADCRNAR
jgi:membrane protease YdiL (CAAX protease family)